MIDRSGCFGETKVVLKNFQSDKLDWRFQSSLFRPFLLFGEGPKHSLKPEKEIMEAKNNERGKKCTILKEGELFKKSSVLKKWRARFVVLNREMLCIFRKEEDESNGRTAQNRIFVMDITLLDDYDSKKMKNCFIVLADGRSHIFSCPSDTDRSMWKRMIEVAQESERREEANNPVRIKSIKLTGALKRLMIHRKKGQGLGCTIKNVGGVIFVNRILEEGPVSKTGVLRPGKCNVRLLL